MGLFRRRKQESAAAAAAATDPAVVSREQDDDFEPDDGDDEDFGSLISPEPTPDRPKRRGLGRLFGNKKKQATSLITSHQQDLHNDRSTTSSEEDEMHDDFAEQRTGPPPTFCPNAPDSFHPSHIQSKITEASNETSTSEISSSHNKAYYNPMTVPPPARQSAFHGPPRFDWIDIEYAAATKIQSVHRRNLVMKSMEKQGLSTSAIRNRKRRRKAVNNKSYRNRVQQHAETPSLFNCCGVGLAFGALAEDDDVAFRDYQRRQYEERIQQENEREDAIRSKYLQEHGMKEANEILKVLDVEN